MTPAQFGILFGVYVVSVTFILVLLYREFKRNRFNFNIFFTLLFFLTFYFGLPFTCLLIFRFDVSTVPIEDLIYALLLSTFFYGIYYVIYKTRLIASGFTLKMSLFNVNRLETHLTWGIMALIAIFAVTVFFINNGFLLFKLDKYSEIFGSGVSGVALKRFFYFFLPAMLVVYFLNENKKMWFFFLISTVGFGLFTYLVVGGTRANIIIAFSLFLFIGIARRWITLGMLFTAGLFGVVAMFWLALRRYGMSVSGDEAFYTFLYLTRDTFSPWENLALLLQNYDKIEVQGLMPIIRDFYVFIPSWLWPDRPSLVLNTANYFTWEVLDYRTGLAISPTLLGSLLIMGGIGFIPLGAVIVGLIIKWFDWLYSSGMQEKNRYKGAILQAFCFGAVFYLIVLAREGLDSFVSRIVFFLVIFGVSLVIAKLLYWLMDVCGLVKIKAPVIDVQVRREK